MGNRAIIKPDNCNAGVYLHWNGGEDSVRCFLRYCRLKDYRSDDDWSYGLARLTAVIANFFGGGLSVGIETFQTKGDPDESDSPGDNGIYIIGHNFEILRRVPERAGKTKWHCDPEKMLLAINEAQPAREQLTAERIHDGCSDLKEQYRKQHPDK